MRRDGLAARAVPRLAPRTTGSGSTVRVIGGPSPTARKPGCLAGSSTNQTPTPRFGPCITGGSVGPFSTTTRPRAGASPPLPHPARTLTEREREVARAVARGAANKEIARELAITERTVKAHVGAILEKLGARDRLQLSLIVNGVEPLR